MAQDAVYVCIVCCPGFGGLMRRSGDSYSANGYDVRGDHPTDANPFGNVQLEPSFSSGGPNWVISTFAKGNLIEIGELFGFRVQ